jgi:hypothetical protein
MKKYLVFALLLPAATPAFSQDPCAQKNSPACIKQTQDRCRQAADADLAKARALPAKDAASAELRDTEAKKIENLINESRSGRVDECVTSNKVSAMMPK